MNIYQYEYDCLHLIIKAQDYNHAVEILNHVGILVSDGQLKFIADITTPDGILAKFDYTDYRTY